MSLYTDARAFLADRDHATIDCDYDYYWRTRCDPEGFPVYDDDGFPIDDGCDLELLPLTPWQAMIMELAKR